MCNLTFCAPFNNSLSPIKVLFCKLTVSQRRAYEEFIKSKEMDSIMAGRRQVLFGIDIVRKICNHPDILHRERDSKVNLRIEFDFTLINDNINAFEIGSK